MDDCPLGTGASWACNGIIRRALFEKSAVHAPICHRTDVLGDPRSGICTTLQCCHVSLRSSSRLSIYATLWTLKFPHQGRVRLDCDWVRVRAQRVPSHIGSPAPDLGYEDSDPYGAFLLPPPETNKHGEHEFMRAVVFVTEQTSKGTKRIPQECVDPLLVLTGKAHARLTFVELHRHLCDALRDYVPQRHSRD